MTTDLENAVALIQGRPFYLEATTFAELYYRCSIAPVAIRQAEGIARRSDDAAYFRSTRSPKKARNRVIQRLYANAWRLRACPPPPLPPLLARDLGMDAVERLKDWAVERHNESVGSVILHKDTSQDTPEKTRKSIPRNPRIVQLAWRINHPANKGRTKCQIAVDFTDGDEREARSLLRGVHRHKLVPGRSRKPRQSRHQ
jgi:hypothetical protein